MIGRWMTEYTLHTFSQCMLKEKVSRSQDIIKIARGSNERLLCQLIVKFRQSCKIIEEYFALGRLAHGPIDGTHGEIFEGMKKQKGRVRDGQRVEGCLIL